MNFTRVFYSPIGNFLKQALKHSTIAQKLFTSPEAEGKQRFLTTGNKTRSCYTSARQNPKAAQGESEAVQEAGSSVTWLGLVLTLCSTLCFMFDLQQVAQDQTQKEAERCATFKTMVPHGGIQHPGPAAMVCYTRQEGRTQSHLLLSRRYRGTPTFLSVKFRQLIKPKTSSSSSSSSLLSSWTSDCYLMREKATTHILCSKKCFSFQKTLGR